MFSVIETIRISDLLRSRYTEVASKYKSEGLLVLLDPTQTSNISPPIDQVVTITKPDGCSIQVQIEHTEIAHSVLGLFFLGLDREDIPLGSKVQW